jgi:ribosomal protein S18 acetylase RimI-like enzyme
VLKLEPLTKHHDRDGFDCGSEPLNLFLRQTARQHAERGISRTFVLVEEYATDPKPIAGFLTLSLCQVLSESLAKTAAKELPRKVGGIRLGRLAVSKARQRQGLGKILLGEALKKFNNISIGAGGIGLFVDAKDQTAKNFYEQFGFVPRPSNELELFLPVRTIQEALKI